MSKQEAEAGRESSRPVWMTVKHFSPKSKIKTQNEKVKENPHLVCPLPIPMLQVSQRRLVSIHSLGLAYWFCGGGVGQKKTPYLEVGGGAEKHHDPM